MLLDICGWVGISLFVIAYYMISVGKIKVESRMYHVMNLVGAGCVGASVFPKQAWPAFVLELVWGGIAIIGLIRLRSNTKNKG